MLSPFERMVAGRYLRGRGRESFVSVIAWFSLVAAEMVSGDHGLGYLIVDSYMNNVTVPMVIGMVTLGFVGWFTSVLVRMVGNWLMQWHVKALALQGR